MTGIPARVQEQGRLTIPVEKRRELGLTPGDYVLVEVRPLDAGGEA